MHYVGLNKQVRTAAALLTGVGTLLSRRQARGSMLLGSSPYLCAATLAWQLACYIATALSPAVHIPSLLQSLGLLVYSQGAPALGYLLAQLGTAVSLAALARSSFQR